MLFLFFFFNDTASTEIYTLSLHDALPILLLQDVGVVRADRRVVLDDCHGAGHGRQYTNKDRKSTRLNSSHPSISYAVFCLKKKKNTNKDLTPFINMTSPRNPHGTFHLTPP